MIRKRPFAPTLPVSRERIAKPYNPAVQPDIRQFGGYLAEPRESSAPPLTTDVRHVWEARPVNTVDTSPPLDDTETIVGADTLRTFSYTVPVGRTFFLRSFSFTYFEIGLPVEGAPALPITLNGDYNVSAAVVDYSLLINGIPEPNNANVGLNDFALSYRTIPAFLIIPEQTSVALQFRLSGGALSYFAQALMQGNLTLSSGIDAQLQVGNSTPLPVLGG